ncbi:hypothetical protein FRC06_003759 [Ceratobasidium sp. 370]|nr:hypothetical protein FRC06_003759 [Ceratobasidium sp. 370]
MGGRKYKFVQSNVAGRSNRSTPAPKRAPQAQKKLPPAQPAHSLQTASESRPPLPKLRIDPTAASSSGTSHQDHNMAHTLGPNRPQVPQDGTSNQNLAGPVQVPQGPPSAFGVSTFERPTLRAPDNTIPAPSGAPTRPVQQVQALPSPYTPDAGVHQMFTESAAAPRDSAPLINETLPSISQRDFQAGASLRVPSNSGRVVCLPTPDITPDVSGLDQQLVFPPKPLRAGSTETNTSQASVPQTRQANGNHQAGAPTAYQAGVQLQGPTNIPLAVPSIYICDTEDIASSPGRASSRDCAQTGNNLNEAPQSGSQQGSKSSSTHRQSNQFSQASAQKRGNSIDHPPVAQSQHQPAQQQPHDIQKVENHAGDKSRSISAISQYSTIKTFPSQPELVRRDEQRQTQVRSPKRERSTNETSPEQQIKRRRGDELRQSSRDAGEGVPERPAPQAARTDNEAFNVSMWSNPGLPRVIGGAEELPVAGTETTSSGNQYPQGRMQAQGWGPSPKKPCATSNSNMKHAPLSHPTPLPFPTDDCSARVATLGTFTCLMTSHTPSSNNIGSAHTIPATIQPRARRGTEAGIESGAIDLGTPLGSSWLDNTVVLAMQSQRATPQVKGKAIGSSSALQPGCASSTPEIGKGMEHTAVDYPGEQGQVASIPGSTTAPAQHGVMGPYNSSSVSYLRSSADLQEPNAPPIGELNFDELIDYDGVDECEMLSNEGYL